MEVWTSALIGAAAGLAGGAVVPRLIALCPDPVLDPDEDPEDYPDHVPFSELGRRPGLAVGTTVAGAVAGAALGAALPGGWALWWLLALLPFALALAVIDFVTWYLPTRLIAPAALAVAALEVGAAISLGEPDVLVAGISGAVGLGLYYGVIWFISPRSMAFGDVRLGALLGLALGPLGFGVLLASVLLAAVLAVLALVPLRRGGTYIRRRIPYGPFLVGGALLAVLVGRVLAAA